MNRLSHKEKGFVRDVAKGLPGVQAALNNYDTDDYSTAGAIASENLKKPKIISALEEALPDKLLDEVHREGLFATRTVFKDSEPIAEEADFNIRAKYLDMAYKRKGSYAPDKHLNVNVDTEVTDELREAANILNEHFRKQLLGSEGDGTSSNTLGEEIQHQE